MAVVDAFPARKRRPLVFDSPKLLSSSSDAKLTRSLFLACHEISSMLPLPFILRRNSLSLIRKVQILASVFDELLRCQSVCSSNYYCYSQSALLCFEEMLLVMHRIKSLIDDCSRASKLWLLLRIHVVSFNFHELVTDLSTVVDILPVHDFALSDDAQDLISLLTKQCSHSTHFVDPRDDALRRKVTDTIDAIKHRRISPRHSTLTGIFNDLGFTDSASLTDEIHRLEDEVHGQIDDRSKSDAASLIGLVRYSKCVLYGPSTPPPPPPPPDFRRHKSLSDANIPPDFRCPITLELMRDPVVISTGQTYDRESIDLWIQSGHNTCPKTGQVLKHTSLIPNRALKSLIVLWCRDQKIPSELYGDGGEVVPAPCDEAAEFTKMMVEFLIENLSASDTNGVVFELRALAKSDPVARACIAEAGAIPKLVRYLGTKCPSLQINAVTTILNLSILEQNKARIMETDGALNGVIEVLRSGATWEAKANAAATLFSLAGVSAYRRRLGRKARVVSGLVDLAKQGPTSSKRDALVAILNLVAERDNVGRFVEAGVVEAAGDAFREMPEEAVAVVEAVVRRGGLMAVSAAFGLIRLLGEVMREGADTARESAAATLVTMCRKGGSELVAEMAAIPGIERVIWEMIGAGTARGGRKAASLMRYLRRWAAGDTHHDTTTPDPDPQTHSIVVPTPSRIFTPVL